MKTLTLKTNLTKAIALTALTIAPALTLTSSAQAAPSRRAPIVTRNNSTWNNGYNNRYNPAPRVQAPRFDPRQNQGYANNRYNNGRFDNDRNNGRFDSRRDNNRNRNNGNDTGKIIGAGIVGAILGAVLSR